MTVATIC